MTPREKTKLSLSCGYITEEAFAEAGKASRGDQRLLAAMALTWFDSKWGDRSDDLWRGMNHVLGRKEKEDE